MVRLTESEKALVRMQAAQGLPSTQIARELGRAHRTVHDHVEKLRRRPPRPRVRSARQLCLAEREEISRSLAEGRPLRSFAAGLGRATSTVSREVARNGGPGRYRAARAEDRARVVGRRPKTAKLTGCVGLRVVVEDRLRGKLRDVLHISQRPAGSEDRAVPGHWEDDLLMGTSTSCIATLVERQSRFVMLVNIPGRRTAEEVNTALTAKIQELPAALFKSLTWDLGKEMSEHAKFTIDTGVQVNFCDPRSPWQRGSNENTNGLLRRYFPKGKTLAPDSQADLDAVADQLNSRPRQTLGFKTPSHALEQALR